MDGFTPKSNRFWKSYEMFMTYFVLKEIHLLQSFTFCVSTNIYLAKMFYTRLKICNSHFQLAADCIEKDNLDSFNNVIQIIN